jgi:hypothetical protein
MLMHLIIESCDCSSADLIHPVSVLTFDFASIMQSRTEIALSSMALKVISQFSSSHPNVQFTSPMRKEAANGKRECSCGHQTIRDPF